MAYCVKCGEKVDDAALTCPACGAAIPKKKSATQGNGGYSYTGNGQSQSAYGGYTYGSTDAQGGGYRYGSAQTQGGYAYGNTDAQGSGQNTYNPYHGATEKNGFFPEAEVRSNKVMAVLCYIGVLVFVPIIAGNRESEYLKLHKNQGLLLFVADAFLNIFERSWRWSAGFFSWFTGGILGDVCDVLRLVMLIFWIMGLVYAYRGTRQELPGIGKIKIFR